MKIQDMTDRLERIQARVEEVQALADKAERELSDEERDELDGLFEEFDRVEANVKRARKIEANAAKLTRPEPRRSEPEQPAASGVSAYETMPRGQWGFKHLGEFAIAVQRARGGIVDNRLVLNAPTTVSTEGTAADGGHAVPPDFREEINKVIQGEDSLLSRTDQFVTSSNQITVPKDETTPWQASGGILTAWTGEGVQFTESKVALTQKVVAAHKLTVLAPVTDELMEDAPALSRYLSRKIPDKMGFAINNAIVAGTGTGQPEGLLDAGNAALVTVAKEGSQVAATVVFENVVKMYSRMYGPSRRNAVWLINQDIEPQLFTMSFEGTSSSVPAYMPANGLASSPFATLMGRPVIPTQACETLGTVGDIIFADLGQYLSVTKGGGPQTDMSMHLYFDYDVTAFRVRFRIGGECWWDAAATPLNSSATLSPYIALATRA